MKLKPHLLIWLTLAASVFADSDATKTPVERPRLTDEMRRRASEKVSDSTGKGDEPILMAPVQVNGSPLPYTPALEEEGPKSRPFTWKDGGTFLKRDGPAFTMELMFQYNPKFKRCEVLRISW